MADPVSIRLSDEMRERYTDLALAEGIGLSPFLVKRLAMTDQLVESIDALRRAVLDVATPEQKSIPSGMMEELILLMREAVGLEKMRKTHFEMQRRGLPIWK